MEDIQLVMRSLRLLTETERQQAWNATRGLIAGPEPRLIGEPKRADFDNKTVSKYPPKLRLAITVLCFIVLGAAFLPSAIRLNYIGTHTFSETINDPFSPGIAGLAVVVLAEVGQVISTLASVVLPTDKFGKRLLIGAAGLSTFIALIGNYEVSKPWNAIGLFPWLEALAPPIMVIVMSWVLKSQFLEELARRQADHTAYDLARSQWLNLYEEAHGKWQIRYDNPISDPLWQPRYANTLREMLWAVNSKIRDGKLLMQKLDQSGWVMMIQRELKAEQWYTDIVFEQERLEAETKDQQIQAEQQKALELVREAQKAIPSKTTGKFVATCPDCGKTFEHENERFAKQNLASHRTRQHGAPNYRQRQANERKHV